ncbi:glutaredoxin 2 [Pasteurellaceae bacterium 20609_3]|uniref:glutaredoxin 2 n=1 Tax=Spirabiliibacterium mucosae TaxID=28156 RepID=UPI001AAD3376|nr:glutaredoxin 2 [Spirabiliibacterium mucosae]MBE2897387.1 glutaredoxin 2 [Spirabiliibacterium mucosae]
MKLYVYEHCPYCVKAMMIFGLKKVPFEKVILMEDDVDTPTKMVGSKVVPILEKDDGTFMPESMDIVHFIDNLDGKPLVTGESVPAIAQWQAEHRETVNSLLYPRFANAPFPELKTDAAYDRYVQRMTGKLGDLDKLLDLTPHFINQLDKALTFLDSLIVSPEAVNGELSEDDFHLFASLRSLTLVKGLQFPEKVAAYVRTMAKKSGVALLDDMAL